MVVVVVVDFGGDGGGLRDSDTHTYRHHVFATTFHPHPPAPPLPPLLPHTCIVCGGVHYHNSTNLISLSILFTYIKTITIYSTYKYHIILYNYQCIYLTVDSIGKVMLISGFDVINSSLSVVSPALRPALYP